MERVKLDDNRYVVLLRRGGRWACSQHFQQAFRNVSNTLTPLLQRPRSSLRHRLRHRPVLDRPLCQRLRKGRTHGRGARNLHRPRQTASWQLAGVHHLSSPADPSRVAPQQNRWSVCFSAGGSDCRIHDRAGEGAGAHAMAARVAMASPMGAESRDGATVPKPSFLAFLLVFHY